MSRETGANGFCFFFLSWNNFLPSDPLIAFTLAMGKKKPFINKKTASTYHVLHRSQRDVSQHLLNEGDTDASGFILWPSQGNNPEMDKEILAAANGGTSGDNVMSEWREKLQEAGLLDDSQERDRYMKEITGDGTFLAANGKVGEAIVDKDQAPTDLDMLEVKDQVENIALKEALDEDIAAILYGDADAIDFEEFEELNDEFVLDAAKKVEGEEVFDYDAHIQKLMEKARLEREGGTVALTDGQHEWARRDQDFFSKANALKEDDEEDDDSFADIPEEYLYDDQEEEGFGPAIVVAPGAAPKLSPEEEKALCEKFEETLLEYDSDEIGDNPEEEIEGRLPLEGDEQVEAALDDFLLEKEDDVFMRGRQRDEESGVKQGGSGFSALVGTRMVPAKEIDDLGLDQNQPVQPIQELLDQATERLAEPHVKPPAEEIFIDGKSYFSERERNPWDCESILSTYSNLDNNPVTIQSSRKRGKRKNKKKGSVGIPENEEASVVQIQLSNKTGLPLGVLSTQNDDDEDDFDDDYTGMSVNKGIARSKTESAAEKKARKAAVKLERQMARIQKKVTRQVYEEEFAKHTVAGADCVAGKPVFRYS